MTHWLSKNTVFGLRIREQTKALVAEDKYDWTYFNESTITKDSLKHAV